MLAQRTREAAPRGKHASGSARIAFNLPPELEAAEPPEARGLTRDGVRLMVSSHGGSRIEHARFRDLPRFLREGDVVVINTSGTLPAALQGAADDGSRIDVHLSTALPGGLRVVELRHPAEPASLPFFDARPGEIVRLPDGGSLTLLAPYGGRTLPDGRVRLWVSQLTLPRPTLEYLDAHGQPIRYGYVSEPWPIDCYRTVYEAEPGSSEMPSAGRGFTPELLTHLVASGVAVAPVVLHTGVSSLEAWEPPYAEPYRVPASTARIINAARAGGRDSGGRIVAVGTTVVRALETVADDRGRVSAGAGWTDVVVSPERGVRAVDALITGLHEPQASHLSMLEAIGGREHVALAYAEALRERYLWHEFGDLHLILP
jgi:S-adenosylmethionine:tRNA ribosyltransferase-isomerase